MRSHEFFFLSLRTYLFGKKTCVFYLVISYYQSWLVVTTSWWEGWVTSAIPKPWKKGLLTRQVLTSCRSNGMRFMRCLWLSGWHCWGKPMDDAGALLGGRACGRSLLIVSVGSCGIQMKFYMYLEYLRMYFQRQRQLRLKFWWRKCKQNSNTAVRLTGFMSHSFWFDLNRMKKQRTVAFG